MSECQKWPHIQTITKRGVPLRDCWEKMPWCQYWQGSNTITYLSDWYPVGHWPGLREWFSTHQHHPWCHHTAMLATTLGSGLKGWVTLPPPPPPSVLYSQLSPCTVYCICSLIKLPVLYACCSTYCLSCNNISLHCLFPHQASEEINFSLYLLAECNITIASHQTQPPLYLLIWLCGGQTIIISGWVLSCHKLYRFLFWSNLQDHYCLLRRAQRRRHKIKQINNSKSLNCFPVLVSV